MAVSKLNPSAGGIPYGNSAGRPANPGVGRLYSNGELQRLELYTGATYGWQNIVAETPGVTGYSGTIVETSTTNTITVSGTNFAAGATVSLIGTDGTEYNATSVSVSSFTSISATFGSISASLEPYDLKVTNPSNLYGVYYDIVTVNDKPIWTTAAGSLGTCSANQSFSIQLSASDEENNSLSYALASGSLPVGLSLSSSGLISGTPTGSTAQTFNFTISVSDSSNDPQIRAFSLGYLVPSVSGGTLSSDSTYYYRTFTGNGSLIVSNSSINIDILTIGGGGGGARPYAGGGGSGGASFYTSKNTAIGTHSITVGGGGAGGAGNGSYVGGTNGVNSQFANLVSGNGGGAGAHYDTSLSGGTASAGGSGGGGGGESSPTNRGASNQTASGSGYVSYGNIGGYGSSGASIYRGGGGGGLGSAGVDGGTGGAGGTGGSGTNAFSSWLSAITSQMSGVSGWAIATSGGYIGGGGGGGIYSTPGLPAGAGGAGGGGNGGVGSNNASSGVTNTGSGGGAAGGIGNGPNGGGDGASGGSGIVIVRYAKASVGA